MDSIPGTAVEISQTFHCMWQVVVRSFSCILGRRFIVKCPSPTLTMMSKNSWLVHVYLNFDDINIWLANLKVKSHELYVLTKKAIILTYLLHVLHDVAIVNPWLNPAVYFRDIHAMFTLVYNDFYNEIVPDKNHYSTKVTGRPQNLFFFKTLVNKRIYCE